MDKSFWINKLIDGLFIFIGVYFAFHFDQFQEDRALKRELKFNLGIIMQSLPQEKPLTLVAPFQLNLKGQGTDNCHFTAEDDFYSSTVGGEFFDLIRRRGLTRFVEDRMVVSLLSNYYSKILPDYQKKSEKFSRSLKTLMTKAIVAGPESPCTNPSLVSKINKDFGDLYLEAKVADSIALQMGYNIRKTLEKLGYVAPPKNSYSLYYKFSMASTPEELKKVEEHRARLQEKVIPVNDGEEVKSPPLMGPASVLEPIPRKK